MFVFAGSKERHADISLDSMCADRSLAYNDFDRTPANANIMKVVPQFRNGGPVFDAALAGKVATGTQQELSDVAEASTSDFCEDYSDQSQWSLPKRNVCWKRTCLCFIVIRVGKRCFKSPEISTVFTAVHQSWCVIHCQRLKIPSNVVRNSMQRFSVSSDPSLLFLLFMPVWYCCSNCFTQFQNEAIFRQLGVSPTFDRAVAVRRHWRASPICKTVYETSRLRQTMFWLIFSLFLIKNL